MPRNRIHDLIRVGISTCLLGQKVRFDGGHKRDRYITDILGEYFRFVPVCPEVEVGMGIPREAVRLVGHANDILLIGNKSGEDWTTRMNDYSRKRVKQPDIRQLSGYLLKSKSPTCGMERVKVYSERGMPDKSGAGLFARALKEHHPLLPVEEEGRLNDPRIRENFIERVFAYHRLRQLFAKRYTRGGMVEFHTVNKYLMLAHSPKHYTELGRLVAAIKDYTPNEFRLEYGRLYMEGLTTKATTKKHVNVLQHILGFLKDNLNSDQKERVLSVIEDYRHELIPLIVPLTLIRHYVDLHGNDFIRKQLYLNPHPKELKLRNHI